MSHGATKSTEKKNQNIKLKHSDFSFSALSDLCDLCVSVAHAF
jgi:hypothetical protein